MRKFKTIKDSGRENRLAKLSAETVNRLGPDLVKRMQAVQCYKAYRPTNKAPSTRGTSMHRVYSNLLKGTYGD